MRNHHVVIENWCEKIGHVTCFSSVNFSDDLGIKGLAWSNPANIYLLKVIIETLENAVKYIQRRRSGVFIVKFEPFSSISIIHFEQ